VIDKRNDLMPSAGAAEKCGRVAVLMGGLSAEREISLRSGNAVLEALRKAGVDAFEFDLQEDALQQLMNLKADRVFNLLHGRGGEDGTIQAVLDMLGIPYTGSGIYASALTMDKIATKRILLGSGIPTPPFMELASEDDCGRLIDVLGFPVFVKPVLEGSSIGMTRVNDTASLLPAWHKANRYGSVFAETEINGSEYTAAFLGARVLPLIKLDTPREFYDYEAKYFANDTIYTCPCGLDGAMVSKIDELVEKTIKMTGVSHWGRVDLFVDEENQPWIIEVNTVPGMTDHSLVPMAGKQAGLEMPDLVLRILELSIGTEARHA
jgi:D-alanine-D-alanine ligase